MIYDFSTFGKYVVYWYSGSVSPWSIVSIVLIGYFFFFCPSNQFLDPLFVYLVLQREKEEVGVLFSRKCLFNVVSLKFPSLLPVSF